MEEIFALVDCNSFFCSCEILFRPELFGKPVGVLSNNDGCFVARTNELKALGVKMGAPYFKVRSICEKNKVHVFSANFALYSNISDRVMDTLASLAPELEAYSIDEAFLKLDGVQDCKNYAHEIKKIVERNTGIPVSIGLAPTKTLAKIANNLAKKSPKANGVVDLRTKYLQDRALAIVPVEDIWGVGSASAKKLKLLGIRTAKELRDFRNDRLFLRQFTKVGLQMKEELSGLKRIDLEKYASKKKSILCSRSFGKAIYELRELQEAIATHISSACEKLRKQKSVCAKLSIFLHTSPFKNTEQYYGYDSKILLSASSDTRKLVKIALQMLAKIYRDGYEYKKAGVELSQITDRDQAQFSLFEECDTWQSESLMNAMDIINHRDGDRTLQVAICGTGKRAWGMNRNYRSPRYVSGFNQLRAVY